MKYKIAIMKLYFIIGGTYMENEMTRDEMLKYEID